MNPPTPTPGSREAALRGCTCPADYNNKGKGRDSEETGKRWFYVSAACPLHWNKGRSIYEQKETPHAISK